jgi:hypothetical protein
VTFLTRQLSRILTYVGNLGRFREFMSAQSMAALVWPLLTKKCLIGVKFLLKHSEGDRHFLLVARVFKHALALVDHETMDEAAFTSTNVPSTSFKLLKVVLDSIDVEQGQGGGSRCTAESAKHKTTLLQVLNNLGS